MLSHVGNGRDQTPKAILTPLQSRDRERVMNSRRLVQKGIDAYLKGKINESLQFYDQAETAMRGSIPDFDNLWIKLKRADTLLRRTGAPGELQNIITARNLIEEVIARSSTLHFDWLLGQALVSKSVGATNSQDYDAVLAILQNAVDRLRVAGSADDLLRPLNYMATVYSLAGDSEKSLDVAYRALRLTQPKDNVRLAQLYWLAGLQLYRMGFVRYAKALEQQAVTAAQAANNYGLVASITPYLAIYHARDGDYASAEKYMASIRAARNQMEAPGGQETADLSLNLLCSQITVARGDLHGAERCLTENLRILTQQARAAPDYFSETLLQLAEIYSAQGRFDLARQQFRRALEVIEENDAYLGTSVLRMPFENQRRNLYDLAIGFEYDQDDKDIAWGYAQRYRSKLFLEFLRQMNSGIPDQAINRSEVQQLIPTDVQVLEYVMLKDRLLIWLVSRDKFFSIAVPAGRDEIAEKISSFLTQVNRKADVEVQASELYKLLIQPIEAQLDPKQTLAIVPDLALHRLNFAALYSAASRKFLIQQYTILESPNLTTLLSGRSARPARGRAVSFGARRDNIGANRELRALQQIYEDVETFNGQTALKPAFLSSMVDASVFHYAGHSQDAADPLRSSVLLDGGREGPNSVTAVEISRRRMPANSLVVLASCDSSVGNSRDGIGMRGLTSAFLISGAGSVVGSLWLVDSESTSRLVLEFHNDFARNGVPVVTALRNAQLAFIAEGAHPYYWSGFVVTGNTSALR